MTIPALLEHVGVHVPRYVTVDGTIVFEQTATAMPQAAPMALQPHQFHGGEDPAPERIKYADAWWNSDACARSVDEEAMRTYFPGFVQFAEDGGYAYGGEINTGRGRFRVLVLPHIDRSLPSIIPLNKNLGRPMGRRLERPPHLYTSGNLCVASASEWKPLEHTTATAVGWAAHWFAAFTEWRITRRWPTDGFGATAA